MTAAHDSDILEFLQGCCQHDDLRPLELLPGRQVMQCQDCGLVLEDTAGAIQPEDGPLFLGKAYNDDGHETSEERGMDLPDLREGVFAGDRRVRRVQRKAVRQSVPKDTNVRPDNHPGSSDAITSDRGSVTAESDYHLRSPEEYVRDTADILRAVDDALAILGL